MKSLLKYSLLLSLCLWVQNGRSLGAEYLFTQRPSCFILVELLRVFLSAIWCVPQRNSSGIQGRNEKLYHLKEERCLESLNNYIRDRLCINGQAQISRSDSATTCVRISGLFFKMKILEPPRTSESWDLSLTHASLDKLPWFAFLPIGSALDFTESWAASANWVCFHGPGYRSFSDCKLLIPQGRVK